MAWIVVILILGMSLFAALSFGRRTLTEVDWVRTPNSADVTQHPAADGREHLVRVYLKGGPAHGATESIGKSQLNGAVTPGDRLICNLTDHADTPAFCYEISDEVRYDDKGPGA
jgi:hypothetical protein